MINENVYRLKKGSYYYVIDQFDSTEEMKDDYFSCLLYTSPSPRDRIASRMPSSA